MYLPLEREARMSVGYFAMPLHLPGSGPARATEQDLDRLGFLDARRFEEGLDWRALHSPPGEHPLSCPDLFVASALAFLPLGEEHRKVTQASLETILTLWQI
jgi:hypothetical protein